MTTDTTADLTRLRAAFGRSLEVSADLLFEAPNVAELVADIAEGRSALLIANGAVRVVPILDDAEPPEGGQEATGADLSGPVDWGGLYL